MPTMTYTPLATVTLGTTASSVTFSSIPATYRDLILVIAGTSTAATNWRVRFNSDSGSNYSFVAMYGTGSAATSNAFSGENKGTIVLGSYGGVTSLTQSILQIMDYSATDKHKTFLARTDSSTAATEALANRWANTAAITTVNVFPESTTWTVGSTFSLYGVIA
jgi:hypothetical protein